MAPDLSVAACPGCGAAVRPGAPWCTQCFHGLAEPAPAPVPAAPAGLPGPAAPGPATGKGGPTWPCTACGLANPMAEPTCAGCGLGFLAAVRSAEPPLLSLPGLGDLTRRSRGQLAAAASGVVLAVVLLSLVVFLALS